MQRGPTLHPPGNSGQQSRFRSFYLDFALLLRMVGRWCRVCRLARGPIGATAR